MAVRVSELGNTTAKAGNGHARAALGSYGDLDDRMLVLDFQAGNGEAFAEIHRRYCGLARHVCQRILRNREDADEATQEAMLRVYQGLARFNGRYALQPWVARIATNVSLDVTRARARRPRTGDQSLSDIHEDLHERCEDPQEAVERALDREQITQVLAELPDHHREALVLREFEGRSHKEIGDALGVTPSQAKALIHRAKGSFRRAWNGGKGLQAFLLLVAALAKVPQLIKKLIQPAQELAATSTAAPAASASVVTTGERVTPAAVAVLVAGSAAVGAVALKPKSHDITPVSSPSPAIMAPAVPPAEKPLDRTLAHPKEARKTSAETGPAIVVLSPTPAPTAVPSASPSPDPSATPTPTPTPTPTLGPPPAYGLAFQTDTTWDQPCDACPNAPWLMSSHVTGTPGQTATFSQGSIGTGLDAAGQPAWEVYLQYAGSVQATAGSVSLEFRLRTDVGWYEYTGIMVMSSGEKLPDGSIVYHFAGPYHLDYAPGDEAVPQRGTGYLEVRFWGDGTSLYQSSLSLDDS